MCNQVSVLVAMIPPMKTPVSTGQQVQRQHKTCAAGANRCFWCRQPEGMVVEFHKNVYNIYMNATNNLSVLSDNI